MRPRMKRRELGDLPASLRESGARNLAATVCCVLFLVLISALLITPPLAQAQTETVLDNFCSRGSSCADGARPQSGMIMDKEGNLYGTADGGEFSGGVVFELSPSGVETVLHSFGKGTDGSFTPTGLIMDAQGNLYGTTLHGGAYTCSPNRYYGCGTVFKLSPNGAETILHNFINDSRDGSSPRCALVMDAQGNLYGTTQNGGTYNYGTVFKISPSGTETIVHDFNADGTDGFYPYAGLVMDGQGNLYGTTPLGGEHDLGTVYKIDAHGTETILHSFGAGTDGVNPIVALIRDAKGNLYGTTLKGGVYGGGTVFKIDARGTETVLYSFGQGMDGTGPNAGVIRDAKGNLYGTAAYGGAYYSGTVFEISASGTETTLHTFGAGTDGASSAGELVRDAKGTLYGTTYGGGLHNGGTVFKLVP